MIPEVSPPTPECPNPEQWSCYDGMATEIEVLGFIESLVQMTKAKVCIETGCYEGHGSVRIGRGASRHGGRLYTCDIDPVMCATTVARLERNQIRNTEVRCCTGLALIESLPQIDFAFLDSDFKGERGRELEAVLPKLAQSGIIAVHDTSRRHGFNGGPRFEVLGIAAQYGLELISFDTPRGLMLLRKPL